MRRNQRRYAVAAFAASLLLLFGVASATNLVGSNDDPTVVRGGSELPLSDAPATSDGDLPDDSVVAEDGTAPAPVAAEATPTAVAAATTAAIAETPATPAPPAPTPAPTAMPTATPPPPTPTSPPLPAPTATPPSAPSCTSPYQLVGTQCLAYGVPYTTAATCPEQATFTGGLCRIDVAFTPLEDQCSGTVSGLTCVQIVDQILTLGCPPGTIVWPLAGDTECGLEKPAIESTPTCPSGTSGVAGPTDGGCYLALGPPNTAGECPDNGPAVSTVIVGGECRQPTANAPSALECEAGDLPWGAACLRPVSPLFTGECPPATISIGGGMCQLTVQLTPQCPSGTSVDTGGTCFRQDAPLPGELACTEGVLENDVCVVSGPDPQ